MDEAVPVIAIVPAWRRAEMRRQREEDEARTKRVVESLLEDTLKPEETEELPPEKIETPELTPEQALKQIGSWKQSAPGASEGAWFSVMVGPTVDPIGCIAEGHGNLYRMLDTLRQRVTVMSPHKQSDAAFSTKDFFNLRLVLDRDSTLTLMNAKHFITSVYGYSLKNQNTLRPLQALLFKKDAVAFGQLPPKVWVGYELGMPKRFIDSAELFTPAPRARLKA